MKKLLFAVCALAAISLLAPNAGFAQDWQNRIGVYSAASANDAATHAWIESPTLFVPTNIYTVLTYPVIDGAEVATIDGFELTMTWTPGTGMVSLGDTYPAQALDIDGATWGYAVGFATPLPVTDHQVLLVTTSVMLTAAGINNMFLHQATVPSIAGMMAVNVPTSDGGAVLLGCTPSSGSFDDANADFAFGTTTTAVESATFGGVKALFR